MCVPETVMFVVEEFAQTSWIQVHTEWTMSSDLLLMQPMTGDFPVNFTDCLPRSIVKLFLKVTEQTALLLEAMCHFYSLRLLCLRLLGFMRIFMYSVTQQ